MNNTIKPYLNFKMKTLKPLNLFIFILLALSCRKDNVDYFKLNDTYSCDGENAFIERVFDDGSFFLVHSYNYTPYDSLSSSIMFEYCSKEFESKWQYSEFTNYVGNSTFLSIRVGKFNDGSIGLFKNKEYLHFSENGELLDRTSYDFYINAFSNQLCTDGEGFYIEENNLIFKLNKSGLIVDTIKISSDHSIKNMIFKDNYLFIEIHEENIGSKINKIDLINGAITNQSNKYYSDFIFDDNGFFYGLDTSNNKIDELDINLLISSSINEVNLNFITFWSFENYTCIDNHKLYYIPKNDYWHIIKVINLKNGNNSDIELYKNTEIVYGKITNIQAQKDKLYVSINAALRSNSGYLKKVNNRAYNNAAIISLNLR